MLPLCLLVVQQSLRSRDFLPLLTHHTLFLPSSTFVTGDQQLPSNLLLAVLVLEEQACFTALLLLPFRVLLDYHREPFEPESPQLCRLKPLPSPDETCNEQGAHVRAKAHIVILLHHIGSSL